MKLRDVFLEAKQTLEADGVLEASLEAELLLRSLTGLTRADYFRDIDKDIASDVATQYEAIVRRRCAGCPSAYLTGKREFYGLDFTVNSHVLIPRPETELLVEKAIDITHIKGYKSAADVGTGSGIIAVTLAVHLPQLNVIATDISSSALEIAHQNAIIHGVEHRIAFRQGNLLDQLQTPVDMICANLPYVPTEEIPATGPLSFEPKNALDGGPDGLDVIRVFCKSAGCYLTPGGTLLMEIGVGQSSCAIDILRGQFSQADYTIYPDYAGIDRLILVSLTSK